MAFSEVLAQRVRDVLYLLTTTDEKKMFGGIVFTVAVIHDNLIVCVGLENYQAALDKPGADSFKPTSRPMAGRVTVAPESLQTDEDMKYWVELALEFVKTLPAK